MAIADKPRPQVVPLDALTGLRFVAALFVFLEHGQLHFPVSGWQLPAVGGTAVAFFYVLSGFILTYVYHDRLQRRGIWKFYFTRWARIWPLHLVCLLAAVFLMCRNPFAESWVTQLKFLSHLLLLQSWIPNNAWILDYNGVAWSISTEMAFYAAFPLLLLAGKRRFWMLYALIGLFSALGALVVNGIYRADPRQFETINALLHFNPLFRIFEFATGMAVCKCFLSGVHQRLTVRSVKLQTMLELLSLGSVILLYLFFHRFGLLRRWINIDDYRPIVHWLAKGTGSVAGFALVVWVFSWSRGLCAKLFSQRWFVYLGEISFAFYLVHQIIQVQVKSLGQGLPLSPLIAVSASLVLTLAFSALLYAVVEVPCKECLLALADRKWSQAIRSVRQIPAKLWTSGILVTAIVACAGATIALKLEVRSAFQSCSDPLAVQRIIASSRSEFKGVVFENEALLHGLQFDQVENGARIRMVWEVLPGHSRKRFIHICDAAGKILRQCNFTADPFSLAVPDQLWVDEVLVENSQLSGASIIGVGFYSPARKSARVNQGPRSMSNHRLDVVQLRDSNSGATMGTRMR